VIARLRDQIKKKMQNVEWRLFRILQSSLSPHHISGFTVTFVTASLLPF
jgi:hypothetical protein